MDSQTIGRLLLIILAAVILFALVAYYNRHKVRKESEKFKDSTANLNSPGAYAAAMPRAQKMLQENQAYGGAGSGLAGYTDTQPRPTIANDPTPPAILSAPHAQGSGSGSASASAGGVHPTDPYGSEQYQAVDFGNANANATPTAHAMPNVPSDCYPADGFGDVQALLPKDAANSKWSQVNPAGQGDVKDQNFLTAGYHLGVNTQGQSLRNGSHDIRGDIAPNPRVNVSPWMQSTIEPDLSRKDLDGFH